jgi:hypothetical protein
LRRYPGRLASGADERQLRKEKGMDPLNVFLITVVLGWTIQIGLAAYTRPPRTAKSTWVRLGLLAAFLLVGINFLTAWMLGLL